jgi:hypothetical protein
MVEVLPLRCKGEEKAAQRKVRAKLAKPAVTEYQKRYQLPQSLLGQPSQIGLPGSPILNKTVIIGNSLKCPILMAL